MINGCVPRNKVEKNAHIPLVYLLKELFQILVGSVSGSGSIVIRNVVSRVSERGHKTGIHPYGVTAQLFNIVKLFSYPAEIAYPVGVRVLKGLGINFIENGVFKPLGLISSHKGILPFDNKTISNIGCGIPFGGTCVRKRRGYVNAALPVRIRFQFSEPKYIAWKVVCQAVFSKYFPRKRFIF